MPTEKLHRLLTSVPAIEVADRAETPVVLPAGTEYSVTLGRFEWLRHEGLYTEIVVSGTERKTFRVRYHLLCRATSDNATASRHIA